MPTGKTCARNPIKADEVMTGTIETVPITGRVDIESTGEGSEGYFADIITGAAERGNDNLTPLEYKLFFYSWMDDVSYTLDQNVDINVDDADYFAKVEKEAKCTISKKQKNWYLTKKKILGEKVQQEYPSTVKEAFVCTDEAFYFAPALRKAYDDGRFLHINLYDALLPLYVAMDIGVNDLTVISFFQIQHGEKRIIDFYADKNKGVDFYARFLLKDKPYHYHTIFLPHDAVKREGTDVTRDYASEYRKFFSGTDTKFVVLKKMDKQVSISRTKVKLDTFVFNHTRTKKFIDQCAKYRKKWSEQLGRYLEENVHDIASNYADCMRYTVQAVDIIERGRNTAGAAEKHRQVVANRRNQI